MRAGRAKHSLASPQPGATGRIAIALFRGHIANKFAIHHQDTTQHTGYAPVFLDWIFWCYLPTIELSNRLLARQTTQTSPAAP